MDATDAVESDVSALMGSSAHLTPEEGDHLYRTSRIVILAEEVFGNREKAIRWLEKPRSALGEISALAAVTTPSGYETVEELLQQLHHGFTA
jgi:putative toxin-antitoxin system antitoxin component (TIGR02293 family)